MQKSLAKSDLLKKSMPELPEVTTIVSQLNEVLTGKTVVGVEVRLPKLFIGDKEKIIDQKVLGVSRRAKMIIIKLENDLNLVIHLKMTGQLIYADKDLISFPNPIPFAGTTLPGKTTQVIFTFDDGSKLFFNDMRQFGWVRVYKNEELKTKIDEDYGPEPLGKDFTVDYLEKICANWGRPIKLLLLEQSKIAGIGNIYANEALWYAGISPMKRGREVAKNKDKVKALYEAIRKVLEMGIKYGGSSASDEAFVNAHGQPGTMQEHFVVYQKNGTPCPRCGKRITRSMLGGRGTFFCPKCQN
jgi:formamidopyrimidine-DNA glycosylase